MKNQIYDLIFQREEPGWQSLIYELVRSGKIDPWDIDISVLTSEYLKMIKKLRELNFRLSGKVVLAAAIFLKLKTNRLGLTELLALTSGEAGEEDVGILEELPGVELAEPTQRTMSTPVLEARIPVPRRRKVTVFELIAALKKALAVEDRRRKRAIQRAPTAIRLKLQKVDITEKIRQVYERLKSLLYKAKKDTIEFSELVPSKEKKDVIWTFVPLLYLASQEKVELRQDRHFGPILVRIKPRT